MTIGLVLGLEMEVGMEEVDVIECGSGRIAAITGILALAT